MIDFSMAENSFTKSTGKLKDNLDINFKQNITPKTKKYHGKVITPSKTQKVVHTIKQVVSDASISVVYAGGSSVVNLYATYWGE